MIRGLIESSLIDWDGKISMVIFFDKCNFRCSFCHNWKLISQSENFPVIEWVAMDIKAPLDDRYNTATRVKADIASIKSSIQLIMHSYIQYEFRTTCVPDIIDENAIHAIGNTIKGAQKWALQGYRPET